MNRKVVLELVVLFGVLETILQLIAFNSLIADIVLGTTSPLVGLGNLLLTGVLLGFYASITILTYLESGKA